MSLLPFARSSRHRHVEAGSADRRLGVVERIRVRPFIDLENMLADGKRWREGLDASRRRRDGATGSGRRVRYELYSVAAMQNEVGIGGGVEGRPRANGDRMRPRIRHGEADEAARRELVLRTRQRARVVIEAANILQRGANGH